MASILLRPVAELTRIIGTTIVHPTFFPYPLALTLHAARVSIAFQNNVKASGNEGKLTKRMHMAGFLVMCWGSSFFSHVLLGLPPPFLYSAHPWINYLSVHIVCTAFFRAFPSALNPRVFDTLLFLPDAILRIGSVTSSLELVNKHADPRISQSIFLRMVIGAIASAGGGMTAGTFGVWTPDWKFSTPVFLRPGGMLSTLDVWAGSLMALIYGVLTASHPTYQSFLLSSSIATQPGPILTPLGAKATVALLLSILYAWRVLKVHWTNRVPARGEKIKKQ